MSAFAPSPMPTPTPTLADAPPRIVHLTTVHPRDDIRIFRKECVSLAKAGYDVVLIVGDGRGGEVTQGVRVVDIGAAPAGRLARMRSQPQRALQAVLRVNPKLVHFHDPELLPLGVQLARQGLIVVYDAHEDVPRQILTKQWIAAPLRRLIAWAFERYENLQVRRLSAVVAATPHIAKRFSRIARRSVNVSNFPVVAELSAAAEPRLRENAVCYVGGIMRSRGALHMVRAMALVPDARLLLCGSFEDAALEAELRAEPGWAQVEFLGQVGRAQVREVMARARAGLVTLLPMPSYLDSLPIKMFEYMSAELPVIASDFPLWRGIVGQSACGVCVDPTDISAIADAMRDLLGSAKRVAQMGRAGRDAVLGRFNWPVAERELLSLYRELLA